MRPLDATLITIHFSYNDTPSDARSEFAIIEGPEEVDYDSDEAIEIGEASVYDSEVFFNFSQSDTIVGNQGEFTVTSYDVVDSN